MFIDPFTSYFAHYREEIDLKIKEIMDNRHYRSFKTDLLSAAENTQNQNSNEDEIVILLPEPLSELSAEEIQRKRQEIIAKNREKLDNDNNQEQVPLISPYDRVGLEIEIPRMEWVCEHNGMGTGNKVKVDPDEISEPNIDIDKILAAQDKILQMDYEQLVEAAARANENW